MRRWRAWLLFYRGRMRLIARALFLRTPCVTTPPHAALHDPMRHATPCSGVFRSKSSAPCSSCQHSSSAPRPIPSGPMRDGYARCEVTGYMQGAKSKEAQESTGRVCCSRPMHKGWGLCCCVLCSCLRPACARAVLARPVPVSCVCVCVSCSTRVVLRVRVVSG
jgi:hypothetical protein